MVKNKIVYIIFVFLLIITYFNFNKSYASEKEYISYDFYIKKDKAFINNSQNMLFTDSILGKTLAKGKIAPGTEGKFKVNVHIANGVISKYKLCFNDFSSDLPKNLKFYFNDEEIDLKTFSLTDIQSSNNVSYLFTWKWEYETEDLGDAEDTAASNLNLLSFNIVLHAEYEEIVKDIKEVLPRSGDISTNF